jgi:hypothetical protein
VVKEVPPPPHMAARWNLSSPENGYMLPVGDRAASALAYDSVRGNQTVHSTTHVPDITAAVTPNMQLANPHISTVVAVCKATPHSGSAFPCGLDLWKRVVVGSKGFGDGDDCMQWRERLLAQVPPLVPRKAPLDQPAAPLHTSHTTGEGIADFYLRDDQDVPRLGAMDVAIDADIPLLGPLSVICRTIHTQPAYVETLRQAGPDGTFPLSQLLFGGMGIRAVGIDRAAECFQISGISLETSKVLVQAGDLIGFPTVAVVTSHVLEGGNAPPSELAHTLSLLPTYLSIHQHRGLAYAPAPLALVTTGGTVCEVREVDHLSRFLPTPPTPDGRPVVGPDMYSGVRAVDAMEDVDPGMWYHARFSIRSRQYQAGEQPPGSTCHAMDELAMQAERLAAAGACPPSPSDEERQLHSVLESFGMDRLSTGPSVGMVRGLATSALQMLAQERRNGVEEVSVHDILETLPGHSLGTYPGEDLPADNAPHPPRDRPVIHRILWSDELDVHPAHRSRVSMTPPASSDHGRSPIMHLPADAVVVQEGVVMALHSHAYPAIAAALLNSWRSIRLHPHMRHLSLQQSGSSSVDSPAVANSRADTAGDPGGGIGDARHAHTDRPIPWDKRATITLPAAEQCAAACVDRAVFRIRNTARIPADRRDQGVVLTIAYDDERQWPDNQQPTLVVNQWRCNACGRCEKFFRPEVTDKIIMSVESFCSRSPREILDSAVAIATNITAEAPANFQHIRGKRDLASDRARLGAAVFTPVDIEDLLSTTPVRDPTSHARLALTAEWIPVNVPKPRHPGDGPEPVDWSEDGGISPTW